MLTISEVAKAHFSGLIVDTAFGVNSPITTITIVVTNDAINIAVAEFSPIILIARLVPMVATVILSKLPINKIVAKKSLQNYLEFLKLVLLFYYLLVKGVLFLSYLLQLYLLQMHLLEHSIKEV